MHGYVGWRSGIDGFLITLISGSLQKGSEPFLYLTPCMTSAMLDLGIVTFHCFLSIGIVSA